MPENLKPRLRILFGADIALGPGKADLLDSVARTGSISAAAREMGMSYRRAWLLVDTMNRCFMAAGRAGALPCHGVEGGRQRRHRDARIHALAGGEAKMIAASVFFVMRYICLYTWKESP